jgi:hypothetical protein
MNPRAWDLGPPVQDAQGSWGVEDRLLWGPCPDGFPRDYPIRALDFLGQPVTARPYLTRMATDWNG